MVTLAASAPSRLRLVDAVRLRDDADAGHGLCRLRRLFAGSVVVCCGVVLVVALRLVVVVVVVVVAAGASGMTALAVVREVVARSFPIADGCSLTMERKNYRKKKKKKKK